MMNTSEKKLSVAFVMGIFPNFLTTFINQQIIDLRKRGINVEIFAFKRGVWENMPQELSKSIIGSHIHYLFTPDNYFKRLFFAIFKILHIFLVNPKILFRSLNFKKYGKIALSLKLVYWTEPFLGVNFDIVHCHFGPIANKYVLIKEVLDDKHKIITTFYGYDISKIIKEKGAGVYNRLKVEGSLFFVMSNDMKRRLEKCGFLSNKVIVHPPAIDIKTIQFKERIFKETEMINIISVGRFVEKKGFDDLLRALAIVKEKTQKPFRCFVVGDGPLKDELYELTKSLSIGDKIDYKGYLSNYDLKIFLQDMHLYVQSSKTAKDGDME